MSRHDEAIDAYRDALEIDANDLQALDHLGIDLHRIGKYDEGAHLPADGEDRPRVRGRRTATASSPTARWAARPGRGDVLPRPALQGALPALLLQHQPQPQRAAACTTRRSTAGRRRSTSTRPTPTCRSASPKPCGARANSKRARQYYLIGLRQDPGNTDVLLDLGDLLLEMGRGEEAGEKFRRAIELAPEEPAGYYYGQWLLRAGRDDEAIAAFSKVLQLDPTYPGAPWPRRTVPPQTRGPGRPQAPSPSFCCGRRSRRFCSICRTCSWTPASAAPPSPA